MPDSQNITMLNKLLEMRENEYGQAWLLSGKVIRIILSDFTNFTTTAPLFVHNWVIMLSKMMRILRSPYNPDHWRDIAGYAMLIVNYLETREPEVKEQNKE
jgi:hypothetical protein